MHQNINILLTSAGRRTQLVDYFKKELNGLGKLVVTDYSNLAPSLYLADRAYIVPPITDKAYVDVIADICCKEEIKGLLSLIDPELSLLGRYEKELGKLGVTLFASPYKISELCLDKYAMYEFFIKNGFNCAKTFISLNKFEEAIKIGEISFPVIIKPRYGSASVGVRVVYDLEDLLLAVKKEPDLIIQEYLIGQEYGLDLYVDMLSNEVVSIFAKKKLVMRAGETDKAVSCKDKKIFELAERLAGKLKLRGQADIDIFEINSEYYISEVNPRFGGGYPLAFQCGCNFPRYIINNLTGKSNSPQIGGYNKDIYMMKHDTLTIITNETVL